MGDGGLPALRSDNCSSLPDTALPRDRELAIRRGVEVTEKIGFAVLFVCLCTLLALYFSLERFTLQGGVSYDGLGLLDQGSFWRLCESQTDTSLLTFRRKEAEDRALKNGEGLLLDVRFEGDLFSLRADVEENVPIFSFDGEVYFANGDTEEEYLDRLSRSALEPSAQVAIKDQVSKAVPGLPSFHFPKDFDEASKRALVGDREAYGDFFTLPFRLLEGRLDLSVVGLSLLDPSADSFGQVSDLLLKETDGDQFYLIRNVDIRALDSMLDEGRVGSLASNLREEIKKNDLVTIPYHFDDDTKTYDVFAFRYVSDEQGPSGIAGRSR